MASTTVAPNTETKKAAEVKQQQQTAEHETLLVSIESVKHLGMAFAIQDDYENESKFAVAFLEKAIKATLKATCQQAIAKWDRNIDKYSKDHPTMNREQIENELLQSKKMRDDRKKALAAVEALKAL